MQEKDEVVVIDLIEPLELELTKEEAEQLWMDTSWGPWYDPTTRAFAPQTICDGYVLKDEAEYARFRDLLTEQLPAKWVAEFAETKGRIDAEMEFDAEVENAEGGAK